MNNKIVVVKRDHLGVERIRYEGEVLWRTQDEILVEAYFGLEQGMMVDIPILRGDKFLETYFTTRWYNIYEIRDRREDHLKGWYCNITYPPEIGPDLISYSDLALDLAVYPNGRQVVLDEDEFEALELSPEFRQKALAGLAELQARFRAQFGQVGREG